MSDPDGSDGELVCLVAKSYDHRLTLTITDC